MTVSTEPRADLSPVGFTNTEAPDVIELRDVSQSYDDRKSWILEHVNFLVEDGTGKGRFVVILGKSGCGKSTLLRYMCGLQTPTLGQVLINGHPRTDHDQVSMVFQQYSSFPWMTVLENVALPLLIKGVPKKERTERAMAMIREVELDGHEHKYAVYPRLSGGQLQRVAIARSLIANPKILLMDEPFGALDTNTRFRMQLLLMKIWQNLKCTIIFVTHDIREAVFLADDIFIMQANPGRIVHHIPVGITAPRDQLLRRDPKFVELCAQVEDVITSMAGPMTKD